MDIQELPHDIKMIIIHMIDFADLARLKCASKYWNLYIERHNIIPAREIRRRKILWKLRQYNPLQQLIDAGVADVLCYIERRCPLVTPELIKLRRPHRWCEITGNPLITIDDLQISTNRPFTSIQFVLRRDSYISVDEMKQAGLSIDWDKSVEIMTINDYLKHQYASLTKLSMFGDITENDIIKHSDIPWEYKYLKFNNRLSIKFLIDHFKETPGNSSREVAYILSNYQKSIDVTEDIGIDEINQFLINPYWPDMYNKRCNVARILQFPEANWNWALISARDDIPISTMLANAHLPWKWHLHCSVVKLPESADHTHPWLQFIVKFENNTLTYDDVLQNNNVSWVWQRIAACKNIPIEVLIGTPHAAAGIMDILSRREDLTFNMICDHPRAKWDLYIIGRKLEQYGAELLKSIQ
jgi:hypothetical protein